MTFDANAANRTVTKLKATVQRHGGALLATICVNSEYRIRLPYFPGGDPQFLAFKWREKLGLSFDQFQALHSCTLDGVDALEIIKVEAGL
jgi:hypothetical protein